MGENFGVEFLLEDISLTHYDSSLKTENDSAKYPTREPSDQAFHWLPGLIFSRESNAYLPRTPTLFLSLRAGLSDLFLAAQTRFVRENLALGRFSWHPSAFLSKKAV